ncbi:hypothetical protein GGF32_000728 [Allomyces javanicus]|nr:hypothetical protein GGF32_000728 [Allomyces javanicus]
MTATDAKRMPVDPENRTWAPVTDLRNIDPHDRIAFFEARDQHLREQWVEQMTTVIIKEKLQRCTRQEGVNAPENCHHLVEAYMDRLRRGGFKSWRTELQERQKAAAAAASADE